MPEPNSGTRATRQGNVARNVDVPHNPELRRRIPIALRATNSNDTATRVTCSKCLSDGAIAGISIGAGIVGVLVVFIVAWFLWGRKGAVTKRRSSHMSAPVTDSSSKDLDASKSDVISLPTLDLPHNSQSQSQSTLCNDNLLQRTDDSPVEKEMQHLNKEINRHCESHYHLRPLDVGLDSVVRQFTASGYAKYIGCGPPVSELALLLYNPETRILAIRRLIATVIFSHINWRTSTDLSLLPPQVAAFCQRIVPGGQEARTEDAFNKAFLQWRHLDTLLISPSHTSFEPPQRSKHDIQISIANNVALLDTILRPCIKQGPENIKRQADDLSAIASQAAQLGFLLVSQKTEWDFPWSQSSAASPYANEKDPGGVTGRHMVVFPGLEEKFTGTGLGKRTSRLVAEPVVVAL